MIRSSHFLALGATRRESELATALIRHRQLTIVLILLSLIIGSFLGKYLTELDLAAHAPGVVTLGARLYHLEEVK